jgi:hypothetical protein
MRIDPDGDQPAARDPQGRASHTAHRSELRGRRLRDIGEVNFAAPCRPSALSGSPAAR